MEDNGVGIDEAKRQRLFESFLMTKDADRGTGLGLSSDEKANCYQSQACPRHRYFTKVG